jgi:transcriptional regulator with XRE-family HTH domain
MESHEPLPQLAANLRASREAAGISQVFLSRRSGVDLSHINKIENARRDPTTTMLLRLARALGTTPAELLRDIE